MDSSIRRSYAERVLTAAMRRKATELLGLAIGARLAEMRERGSALQEIQSSTEQSALHARLLN